MRGLLTVGILALLPVAALAQWHGASAARPGLRAPVVRPFMARPAPLHAPNPRGGGLPFRPGVPGVTLVRPNRPGGFHGGHIGLNFGFGGGSFPFGVPPQNRCFSDAFFDPFFCTRRPVRSAFFSPFLTSPFFGLPVIWDSGQDYSDMAAQQMAEQTAQASAQASDLTSQIEQLREELRQLREQPSAPPPPAPAPAAAQKEAPPVPTTLIFRDGRRSEVTNYAIVGGTLWIFNDQRARKVPVASLDIPATQQANEDRGVDFVVPASVK